MVELNKDLKIREMMLVENCLHLKLLIQELKKDLILDDIKLNIDVL